MTNLLLIGAGNMGYAMLSRWAKLEGLTCWVVDAAEPARMRAAQIGVAAFADIAELPPIAFDVAILATKPQGAVAAVSDHRAKLSASALLISVAAGVTSQSISAAAPGLAVIRAMPNTPAMIGAGMSVCYPTPLVSEAQKQMAEHLLASVGLVEFVTDERLLDAVTAVSGSGPAYVFHFIEALTRAGEAAGLEPGLALRLAKQTVLGAAELAKQSDASPSDLRQMVTSPNGTTAAALSVLMREENGLAELMLAAVEKARARSVELSAASA